METEIQSIAHFAVALYAFFLFSVSFRRRREIESFYQISLVNAGMGFWNYFLFLYYVLDTPEAVYVASSLGFAVVSVTVFGLFLFSWRLAFGDKRDRILPLFAAIPVITCLLSVTAPFHKFFLAGQSGFTYIPLRELVMARGPWFGVHSLYSYFLLAATVVFLVASISRLRGKSRPVTILLVVSILAFTAVLSLSNFTSLKAVVQPYAFLAHLFVISAFYWSTFLNEDDSVVYFGKHRFFEVIGMPVLMFNRGGELVHLNKDARRYFEDIHFPLETRMPFERFLDGRYFTRISVGAEESTIAEEIAEDPSFFAQATPNGQILYCQRRDIESNRSRRIGFSVTLFNLRTTDAFIHDLEKRAYTDSLCQCLNRTCFEQRKDEILQSAPRPLVLFIADLDNLKLVNDSIGHRAGDEYLSACAGVLKRASRANDTLFRIGGDEFALFISCPDEAGILRVQKAIASELAALRLDFPHGISVGYSIIGEGDFDYEKHFKIADAEMYRRKKKKKRP